MREEVAATDSGRGALRFYGRWEAVKKRGGARTSVRSAADQLAIGEIPFEGGCYVMERRQGAVPLRNGVPCGRRAERDSLSGDAQKCWVLLPRIFDFSSYR